VKKALANWGRPILGSAAAVGNFNDALRATIQAQLKCPKCGAVNRPGATLIAVAPDWEAACGACAHVWHQSKDSTFQSPGRPQ